MCGFAGVLEGSGSAGLDADALARMCDSMIHRGPDDRGVLVAPPVHLGFRRLSIIDVAGGHQPMQLGDDGPAIVFNGEIYNFRELRTELEAKGHVFRTHSDTEVLLHAWAEWGLDTPSRLRGMFAFAVWEPRIGRLVLVRDRLGIKPLHWASVRGCLVFGSELQAVVASGLVRDELDRQAIDDYFAFGWIRAPRTIFADVRKLQPGRMLVAEREVGGLLRLVEHTWWRPPVGEPPLDVSRDEAKERLGALLSEAVRIRLVADVPLGAFLSGGIDSSTIVALMARQSDRPVETFSIGFDDAAHDESELARLVGCRLGTNHHERVVRPDAVAVLPAVAAAHGEPFGDPSAIPTWYLCQMTRERVTVALSGDGGDELFAGYVRYGHLQRELSRRRPVPSAALRLASRAARLLPRESRRRGWLERLALPPEQHYARFRANFPEPMRRALFTPELAASIDMRETARVFGDASLPADPVARMQAADLAWYLPDDVLTKVDRMSMAHSLEARVPMLDHHVVELAVRLPTSFKMDGRRTKLVLRDLMPDVLPREVLEGRKHGFSVPLRRWLGAELRPLVEDTLASETYGRSGWFEPDYVRRLWSLHATGARDLSFALWQLLVFRVWNEQVRPSMFAPPRA